MIKHNKNKRPRESPEFDRSFVKRVSGLLPSSITRWFGGQSSSMPNEMAAIGEVTDSATEDEGLDSPFMSQSLGKRMRLSQSTSNHYLPTTTSASTNTDAIFLPQDYKETAAHKASFKKDNNLLDSALSSKTEKTELNTPKVENRVSYILKNSLSSGDSPLLKKRKSLLDIRTDKTAPQKNRSHHASSHLGSPFYHGTTTYGGASNISYNRLQNDKIKVTLNKSVENSDVQMSTSARQIMDLLENYSSPLKEVRRISQFVNALNSFNSVDTTSDSLNTSKMSYKTQELHVPSLATILRIKKKSRLTNTTSSVRKLLASQTSTLNTFPYIQFLPKKNKNVDKFETKIKRKKPLEDYQPLVPDLPSNILKIDKDNLPKFSFNTSTEKTSESTKLSTITSKSCFTYNDSESNQYTDSEINNIKPLEPKKNHYDFCKPDEIRSNIKMSNETSMFLFVNPETSCDQLPNDVNVNSTDVVLNTSSEKLNTINKLSWNCSDCLVKNNLDVDKCVCCGGERPPNGSKKCAVCNIAFSRDKSNMCGHCEKKETKVIPKLANSLKWNCQDCWVNNEISSENCVSCGGKKPLIKTEINKTVKQAEKRKCCNCSLETTCTNCSMLKPLSLLPSEDVGESKTKNICSSDTTDAFKIITKIQTEMWQCQTCLVYNDTCKRQCVCCENEKPGTSKSDTQFKFIPPSNKTFPFGIDPKLKQAENDDNVKIELKETNNDASTKTFSFGIPINKSNKKCLLNDGDKTKAASSIPFTFGIPKESQNTTIFEDKTLKECDTLKQNIDVKVKLHESEIKIDELKILTSQPQSDLKIILPSQTTHSLNAPQEIQSKTLETTDVQIFTGNGNQNQNLSSNVESKVKSIMEKPVVNLSFNASTSHSSSNKFEDSSLFPDNKTPVTSNMVLFGNLQSPSTSTSELPLFQLNDASKMPATTSSLIFTPAIIDPTSSSNKTTSIQTHSTTAALFSFGSNNKITNDNNATMKFSFGNIKTEKSNMFPSVNSPVLAFSSPVSDNTGKFNPPKMKLPNLLSNINSSGLSSGGNMLVGNNQTEHTFGSNTLAPNALNTGNTAFSGSSAVTNASGIFGNRTQKENNGWSPITNMFSTANPSSVNQKPATFTFGGSMSLDNNIPSFCSNTPTSLFAMPAANTNDNSSLFSPINTTSLSVFGSVASAIVNNNVTPVGHFGQQHTSAMGGFGISNSTFGETSNQSMPLNFSAGQNTGIFNFSQKPQQAGVYGFGGAATPQFKVGSSSTPVQARRMRKAVRRTTQR